MPVWQSYDINVKYRECLGHTQASVSGQYNYGLWDNNKTPESTGNIALGIAILHSVDTYLRRACCVPDTVWHGGHRFTVCWDKRLFLMSSQSLGKRAHPSLCAFKWVHLPLQDPHLQLWGDCFISPQIKRPLWETVLLSRELAASSLKGRYSSFMSRLLRVVPGRSAHGRHKGGFQTMGSFTAGAL